MKMIVESRPSSKAQPRRGYHDFICKVEFQENDQGYSLSDEAQERMVRHLAQFYKNNMWCWGPTKVAPNTWEINYGYDSGD